MYAGASLTWFFRTHRCMTTSTLGSEHVATRDRVKESYIVANLLSFMHPEQGAKPILVYEDSEGEVSSLGILLPRHVQSTSTRVTISSERRLKGEISRLRMSILRYNILIF